MGKLLLVMGLCAQASLCSASDMSVIEKAACEYVNTNGLAYCKPRKDFIACIDRNDMTALQEFSPVLVSAFKQFESLECYAHAACLETDVVYTWLESKGFPTVQCSCNVVCVLAQCSFGYEKLQRGFLRLTRKGFNLNQVEGLWLPPLHYAICEDNLDAVKALLVNGAQVTVKDQHNRTPLNLAQNLGPSIKKPAHKDAIIALLMDASKTL